MTEIQAQSDINLETIPHTFFFSNRLSMMPDVQEIGTLITSYGRLLKAHQKVLLQIDPEFQGAYVEPHLRLYQETGSGVLEWVVKLCWGDQEKADKWAIAQFNKTAPLRWVRDIKGSLPILTRT